MAIEQFPGGGIIITGEADIELYRVMTIRSGLSLELKGIKVKRGPTCYAIAKKTLGLKGSRESVLAQLDRKIEEAKARREAR